VTTSGEKCIEREDFYLSSENHEYNILEKAGSRLGRKHYEETKTKISDALKGEKNPMHGKPKPSGAGTPSQIFKFSNFQAIEVFDNKNNQTTTYDSIRAAARALNLPSHKAISYYIKNNQKKPYKGRYTLKKNQKKL